MGKKTGVLIAVLAVWITTATAQDARQVLEAAAAAIGATNLQSVQYSATGWLGIVGQSASPAEDWPKVEIASYTRTIDFASMSPGKKSPCDRGTIPRAVAGAGSRFRESKGRSTWSAATTPGTCRETAPARPPIWRNGGSLRFCSSRTAS